MKKDPNIEAYRLLRGFVPQFRDFVKGQLVVCYGAEQWLDGVPSDVRQRLSEFEKKWGENAWVGTRAGSPLDFSYEEDLIRIVTEERNWTKTFRRFFPRDPNEIKVKFRDIRRTRDHVAHFRVISWDKVRRLRDLCEDIRTWITEAGVREAELESKFELGAVPNDYDVQPTRVHQFFDGWVGASEDEVLMFQSFAPREPVARRSRVYLAIRYNPVALKAPGAKRQGIGFWRRMVRCVVRDPTTEQEQVVGETRLHPEEWARLEYVPEYPGLYSVTWGGRRPRSHPWVRDDFVVA